MSRLEDKLKELGYELNMFGEYQKQDIIIFVLHNKNKIIKKQCYVLVTKEIRNRNDMQELKESIDYYNEQLMTMYEDLEVLKEYEL